jgi:hypothetical protein
MISVSYLFYPAHISMMKPKPSNKSKASFGAMEKPALTVAGLAA